MKWLRALLGQQPVPASRLERVFALSTARVTLEATFGLRPAGRAEAISISTGLCGCGVNGPRKSGADQI